MIAVEDMSEKTTHERVYGSTRWALKMTSAEIDCSIAEVLARVEHGDAAALSVWQKHARWVAKQDKGGR